MSAPHHYIRQIQRRALVDIRLANGLRVRRHFCRDPHTPMSSWHLTLSAGAATLVLAIRLHHEAP